MKLRKIMALLLALVMAFALTACAKSGKDSDSGSGSKKKTSSKMEDPIDLSMQAANLRSVKKSDLEELYVNQFGGLGAKQLQSIFDVLTSSENFSDYLEDRNDYLADQNEELSDYYGDDWKCSYEIEDKAEFDSDDQEYVESDLADLADSIAEYGDYILDLDSDDMEELADDMGISVSDLKKLGKALNELAEVFDSAEFKEGYTLDLELKLEGSEDSYTFNQDFSSVKFDSCWLSADMLYTNAIMHPLYAIGFYDY